MSRPDIIQNRSIFNDGALVIRCKPTKYHQLNTITVPNFLTIDTTSGPQMWMRKMEYNYKTNKRKQLAYTLSNMVNFPINIDTQYLTSIDIFVLVKDINIINTPKNTMLYIDNQDTPLYKIKSIKPAFSYEI
mgnify:CR=1 FL=1